VGCRADARENDEGYSWCCLFMFGVAIGAFSVMLVQDHMRAAKTLQVRGLEIVDAHNNVRAVLATDESDGTVYLRMHQKLTLQQLFCKLQRTMAHSALIPVARIVWCGWATDPMAML
jgi:hypothetical protein